MYLLYNKSGFKTFTIIKNERYMQADKIRTDADIIAQFQNGDEKAFAKLVNRYAASLYTYLYRMTGDKQTAEDLLQDLFVKVLKALPSYREQGKFSSWIFGIAHRLAVDFTRKKKRRAAFLPDIPAKRDEMDIGSLVVEESLTPEELMHNKEHQQILSSAIDKLPPEQKQVLLLREHGDLSFREIAELVECPLNTVLGRMRYALLNLRKIISHELRGEITDVLR